VDFSLGIAAAFPNPPLSLRSPGYKNLLLITSIRCTSSCSQQQVVALLTRSIPFPPSPPPFLQYLFFNCRLLCPVWFQNLSRVLWRLCAILGLAVILSLPDFYSETSVVKPRREFILLLFPIPDSTAFHKAFTTPMTFVALPP